MTVSVRREIIQVLDDSLTVANARARWCPELQWHYDHEHLELMRQYEQAQKAEDD